jgi:hypothetical protein
MRSSEVRLLALGAEERPPRGALRRSNTSGETSKLPSRLARVDEELPRKKPAYRADKARRGPRGGGFGEADVLIPFVTAKGENNSPRASGGLSIDSDIMEGR